MPTPAYIDTALYLPAGGVDGFELNGHAVNGPGIVDSPFAGVIFELDPYRSILMGEPSQSVEAQIHPSLLNVERSDSYQMDEERDTAVPFGFPEVVVVAETRDSEVGAQEVSLADAPASISMVPPEYRTAYVLATDPALVEPTPSDSDVDELPVSAEPDEGNVSYVPKEYRTVKVRRGDS